MKLYFVLFLTTKFLIQNATKISDKSLNQKIFEMQSDIDYYKDKFTNMQTILSLLDQSQQFTANQIKICKNLNKSDEKLSSKEEACSCKGPGKEDVDWIKVPDEKVWFKLIDYDKKIWPLANSACKNIHNGQMLASIFNSKELDVITKMIQNLDKSDSTNSVWINIAGQGKDIWLRTGEDITFNNFNPGERNKVDQEFIGLYTHDNFRWHDFGSTERMNYLCEIRCD